MLSYVMVISLKRFYEVNTWICCSWGVLRASLLPWQNSTWTQTTS